MGTEVIDVMWIFISAGLVFLMQAGFLSLESGLTRSKNNINVAIKNLTDFGLTGRILGAVMASFGIFLPGTFLIFFVIRFWEQLKKYRIVKASLEGINAVSAGMVIAAAFLLYVPMEHLAVNYVFLMGTVAMLLFTKVPTPVIICVGLILGLVIA